MPEIRPIKNFRNTSEISGLCHRRNESVYIMKNGYGHLAVMNMETYREKLAKAELYEKLAKVETELNNQEGLLDAEKVFEKLKERYQK